MSLGFYFDMNKCIGCKTCEISCKDRNDLGPGIAYRHVRSFEAGAYPDASIFHYSAGCNHCEQPMCVASCPTEAVYIAEDGTVQLDLEKCTGCAACVEACPYSVPQINENGVMGKCDSCASRRKDGEMPACVEACHMRCLDFGEKDELAAKYGPDLVSELPILPDGKTGPQVLISAKPIALDGQSCEKYF